MNSIIKLIAATAIATSSTAILFTATVHAQSTESRSVSVETADLDLSSQAGQKQLNGRISRAANEVCGEGSNLAARSRVRDCIAKAKSQALSKVKGRDGRPLAIKTSD